MKRRKFVLGLGSLAAGGTAILGTNAVSSGFIDDREIIGNMPADGNAYVAFRKDSNTHGWAVDYDGDGRLQLNFSDNGLGGLGVNVDSRLNFDDVFNVFNADADDYEVWFDVQNTPGTGHPNWIYADDDKTDKVNSPGNAELVPAGNSNTYGVHLDMLDRNTFPSSLEVDVHLEPV